jgi:transposase InsO family protein
MKRKKWPLEVKLEVVRARQRGLSCAEVTGLTGMSLTAINRCVKAFKTHGVAGLDGPARKVAPGRKSAKRVAAEQALSQLGPLPEGTGVGKVQGLLYRLGFLKVSKGTVEKVMAAKLPERPKRHKRRRNKPVKVRNFERARPNELWQTDIMTFMLKGQYRVYLIGFMDDNSRFLVGWGLFRFQTTKHVQEVFRAAIEKHGVPKEVLSDNGRQYYTWRGKSQFTIMLTKLGVAHIRSRPYHPQTCGKIESFWRNMWQECLSAVPLSSFEEAEQKIGEYITHYNFKRPHQGIGNLVPADRFYRVGQQVKDLVAENTVKVAEQKPPLADYRPPTYLVGNIGGKELRMIARSAEVTLRDMPPENVELSTEAPAVAAGAPSEDCYERADEKQVAEPGGAAGADPAGSGAASAGQGAVQTGGSVPGVILSVAESSAVSGAASAGDESAGSEGIPPREGGIHGPQTEEPGGAPGAGCLGVAEGTGPLAASGGNGEADNPPQCLGAGDGAAV